MTLSRQLIQNVAKGNIAALQQLHHALTTENYVTSALDAVLVHLQPELIENASPYHGSSVLDRGGAAILCLYAILFCCDRSPGTHETTVQIFLRQVDGLVTWFDFAFVAKAKELKGRYESDDDKHSMSLAPTAMVLNGLIDLDPRLAEVVMASPKAMALAVKHWTYRQGNGRVPFPYNNDAQGPGQPRCPVACLLDTILSQTKQTATFFDVLLSSPTISRGFFLAFLSRIDQLVTLCIPDVEEEAVIIHAFRLWHITAALIKNEAVHSQLLRLGYLRAWTQSIWLMSVGVSNNCTMTLAAELFDTAVADGGNPIHGIVEVVEAGLVPIIVDSICSYLDEDEPTIGIEKELMARGRSILLDLAASSVYPRCVRALKRSLKTMRRDQLKRLSREKDLESLCNDWVYGVNRCFSDLAKIDTTPFYMCDNNTATHVHQSYQHGKWCSGCHSVYYCSRACQKADWSGRHRMECARMRASYVERTNKNIRYTWKMRAFHLAHISRVFEEVDEALKRGGSRWVHTVCAHHAGPELFSALLPVPVSTYPMERAVGGDCEAMEDRVDEILDAYDAGEHRDGRLMDTIFSWKHKQRIAVLTEHRRLPDPSDPEKLRWTITRSVVRIEPPPPPLPRSDESVTK